eukprot:451930-Lingulodinium_polyedra.AAC.1
MVCTPPKRFKSFASRVTIQSSAGVKQAFHDVPANVDAAAKAWRAGICYAVATRFRCYAVFGKLRGRAQAIKDENPTDLALPSSVSKVIREVVSTSGLIRAADQA